MAAAAVLLGLLAPRQAAAQTRAAARARSRPPQAQAAPAPQEAHPPYEPQLLRLAEIIGALAYLRDLCGDDDGDKWRAKMADLLAAEKPHPTASASGSPAPITKAFHGYRAHLPHLHRQCRLVIDRYLDEGERLTRDVENRYGGS